MNTIYVGFKTRYVSMGFVVVNRPRIIFERFCVFLLYSLLAFYMEQRRKINNFKPALHYSDGQLLSNGRKMPKISLKTV
jgi:glucan biosynthesis protein